MNEANSPALYKIVSAQIQSAAESRITFAEYMELALYHEDYGYYSSGKVGIGSEGDFFTAVSLGADFGELLGIQLVEIWHKLGCPQPFHVVEMGAGNGDLAFDILGFLMTQATDFIEATEYIIIEKSPKLIARQQQRLADYTGTEDHIKITWQDWSQIHSNSITGCFISNELLDAFPVHRVIKQDKLQELYLSLDNGKLTEKAGKLSTNAISEYFELIQVDLNSSEYPESYTTEVNLAALDWLATVHSKLQQGYIITIDYGYDATKYYYPRRNEGTLQCYYQHRRHNNPYVNLGEQDITSHVNFTALENYGAQHELETVGFLKQGLFLMALGLGDRLQELSSGKFNMMQIMQRRDALHQLINPMGLGGFGVLVQGKGLDASQKTLKGLTIPT